MRERPGAGRQPPGSGNLERPSNRTAPPSQQPEIAPSKPVRKRTAIRESWPIALPGFQQSERQRRGGDAGRRILGITG